MMNTKFIIGFKKIALAFGVFLLIALPSHARRVALVIGNDNYANVTKLQKAGNDATSMAKELRAAGFTVQLQKDLNYRSMVKVIESFTTTITGGDEVVVFYAGHGVQIKNGSYLLPTDIEAHSEKEVEKTAYELSALTDMLSEARPAFSLVIVDACRDNPLKSSGRSVGNSRGLSAFEPPKGQIVVYSASRGQQALDKLNEKDANPNGVFTREFIARMKKPGVKIEDLIREVQDSVESLAKTANHEQRPAVYNEARGNFYFFEPKILQIEQPANKPETLAPSIRPSQVYGLGLADLEREESTRKEWAVWQGQMKIDFDETAVFSGSPDLIVKGWDRFLLVWAQDNPLSKEDEALRAQALTQRYTAWQVNSIAQQVPSKPISVLNSGDVIKDCPYCPEMVVIPSGAFMMGSGDSYDESPLHSVNVRTFLISKTEVTQGQWLAVMGNKPSYFSQCGENCPVENISWHSVQEFIQRLSQKTNKKYHLPSEAEWEYAARSGTQTKFSFGDNEIDLERYAWVDGFFQGKTHSVAEKMPNAFGLFDMYGNVWEWTQDCWNRNYVDAPNDGSAWNQGDCSNGVLRGSSSGAASFIINRGNTYRLCKHKSSSGKNIGFRVTRTP